MSEGLEQSWYPEISTVVLRLHKCDLGTALKERLRMNENECTEGEKEGQGLGGNASTS